MGEISNLTSKKENYVIIKINSNDLKYDKLIIFPDSILKRTSTKCTEKKKPVLLKKDFSCGDFNTKNKIIPVLYLNGILVHYIVQELEISSSYRKSFIEKVESNCKKRKCKIIFQLTPVEKQIIDYSWNERTTNLAWERVELDHALSWLSTLGGAFSALGDYFVNCALIAGKISVHQLKLALRLGDPNIAARCKLFYSLSLIQRGHLKLAKSIIYREYIEAKNAIIIDVRLVRMCQGIWAKLKYEYEKKLK